MPKMSYDDVEEGMVVLMKKKNMKVTEIEEKQAIGKDPTKMKIKLIGFDVATNKPMKSTFRRAETMIEVVEGGDSSDSEDEAPKNTTTAAKKKKVTKSLADFDMNDGGAGASKTEPIRAGEVKKGSFVLLKEKPCKVISVSVSKTGKHGHAKANITGLDVFTGKKYNEVSPTSHNMVAPVMFRTEWMLTDIQMPDGDLVLMDEGGEQKIDLSLPRDTSGELTEFSKTLQTRFQDCPSGKAVYCIVLKAMDTEQVVDILVKAES